MTGSTSPPTGDRIVRAVIRPMASHDVATADRVMRVSFGTFLGATDPATTFGEAQFVRTRFVAEPSWAFVAEHQGEVVGSVFATRWGSFGFFGPLTVRPDLWDRGIARQLMEPVVALFDQWPVRLAGLFTFAQSAKHVGLYQRFDFWPRYLTAVMAQDVVRAGGRELELFSELGELHRAMVLSECAELTDAIFRGLDVGHEIHAVYAQDLGDTVLVRDGSRLVGLAVCHGEGGETGAGRLYVKFAAARPGVHASRHFALLLEACEQLALERGAHVVVAGVNTGRHEAYRLMLEAGYRTGGQGVRMHRPNDEGMCAASDFVIDDLR
jgi:GNAT superfamily N-acetyltransferase